MNMYFGGAITLFENHTYSCYMPAISQRGILEKATHSGVWVNCGEEIIFNSYRQPDGFPATLIVHEKVDTTLEDQVKFIFHSFYGKMPHHEFEDSIMIFGATGIMINNEEFKVSPTGVFLLKSNEKPISFTVYSRYSCSEEYLVKNPEANVFEIELPDYLELENPFPTGSFFKNARMTLRNDTLFYISRDVSFFKVN